MTCACRGIWSTSWWSIPTSGRRRRRSTIRRSPARSCGRWSSFNLAEHGVEKVVARRAAMELQAGMTANLGFGICSMVPRILLEEGHPRAVTWAIEQGAVGGMPLTGLRLRLRLERRRLHALAAASSPTSRAAGFDVTVPVVPRDRRRGQRQRLEARQEAVPDRRLRRLRRHHGAREEDRLRRSVRGGRGARADRRRALRVAKPGKFPKMVEAVEHVTFSGRRARETGQEVLYVTERCVIRLTDDGPRRDRDHAGHRSAARHRRASLGR